MGDETVGSRDPKRWRPEEPEPPKPLEHEWHPISLDPLSEAPHCGMCGNVIREHCDGWTERGGRYRCNDCMVATVAYQKPEEQVEHEAAKARQQQFASDVRFLREQVKAGNMSESDAIVLRQVWYDEKMRLECPTASR